MTQKNKPSGGRRALTKSASQKATRPRCVAGLAAAPPATTMAQPAASAAGMAGAMPLGTSLSIREVGERAAELKGLLATGSAVIDARQLESVDTAGLQLLLAAAAAARRRGLTLKLLGAGDLRSGAADALGLAEQLAATAEILP
jgi:anti-anti-sigma regulatory factor